jgi:hypothetical protein
MKLLPFTVRVKAAPPALAEDGESEVIDGTGLLTVSVADAETDAPAEFWQARVYVRVPADVGSIFWLPEVFCAPLKLPLAAQEALFVDDQLRVALCPTVMEVGETDMLTVGAGIDGVGEVELEPPAPQPAKIKCVTIINPHTVLLWRFRTMPLPGSRIPICPVTKPFFQGAQRRGISLFRGIFPNRDFYARNRSG